MGAVHGLRRRIRAWREWPSQNSGKEVFAKAIHNCSLRDGKFIPVNCGAISPELIESELFGHEKGAFNGAMALTLCKSE